MRNFWTEDKIDLIRQLVNEKENEELAQLFNVTKKAIGGVLYHNKIKRDKVVLSNTHAKNCRKMRRICGDYVGENNPNWKNGISKNNYHYKKLQIERYPEKVKARDIVKKALMSGKLIKQPCEFCDSEESEAHHDDYSKPLEVRWMCDKHHKEYHKCLKNQKKVS